MSFSFQKVADSKFNSIFQLISKYNFSVGDNSLSSDPICVICKKLIVDAVVSNTCDCRYCYKCITDFISNESKYCPGGKDDCKVEHIVLGKNACRSYILNKIISQLHVNCPNHLCFHACELLEMENHLRFCTKKSIDCPFITIGCSSEVFAKDKLDLHMQSDVLTHSQLLIDLIQSMRNEMKELRNEVAEGKLEVQSLKEALLKVRNEFEILTKNLKEGNIEDKLEISSLYEKLDEMRRYCALKVDNAMENLINTVTNDIETNKLEIASIKEELEKSRKNCKIKRNEAIKHFNKTMTDGIDPMKLEIDSLRGELEQKEDRIMVLEEELKELIGRNIAEARMTREAVAAMGDGFDKMTPDRLMCSEERKKKTYSLIKSDKLCPNIDADYVWRVDGYSRKIGTSMFGGAFYSDDYKLCLSMYIYGDGRVDLCCYIMKGDKDDEILWPMKRAVTLGIVNQLYLVTDTSETRDTAFDKPKTGSRDRVCTTVTIKDTKSVIVNDSIVISCVIHTC